ncbi:hypothetical protein PMZ80_007959 [Knufia obscura]|uniref:Zn(2)-C6 fungal-type domain-containing protein n=1 Tax=Knufia obscura TaxID=1635080 RepID=A0ABR0RG42_9EURO|nr:hypothetical protein PMZ80_007959 [Knufia obscura]
MSGPYDYPMSIPPLDHYDPSYSVYDLQYGGFQRPSGPPTPHEGFAFWYRPPDAQESIYGRDPSIVKCDETRPICDRCRKGNRECEFPQSTSAAKRAKTGEPKSATSETGSDMLDTIKDESEEEEDYEEEDEQPPPPPPPKQRQRRPSVPRKRAQTITGASKAQRHRQQSNVSSASQEKPSSPSEASELDTPLSPAHQRPAFNPSERKIQLKIKSELKQEMETYLRFQHDYMTYYHYLFKLDPEDFVHGELIDLALRFEPLLYAVIAFAAYHYTVRLPESEADFNSFWKYYCKSIVKLREHLAANKERNDLVLLTVLQLATFEEYMGDWTNLATHHRAAHGIITSRYKPETIMSTDRGRKMFDWYMRLDVISGLMAVRDIAMDRSWLAYAELWHIERMDSEGGDQLHSTMERFGKSLSLIAHDIAHTFAQANQNVDRPGFSLESVLDQVKEVYVRLDELRRQIQELNDPALAGVDSRIKHTEDEAFDANIPLFRGELWPLNFVWIDWYGMYLLLKNQTFLAMRKARRTQQDTEQEEEGPPQIPPELINYAKIQCQIYNAIAQSTTAPAGATLVCYANLGLSTVFLPREPPGTNAKYTRWARRQLAKIEQQGYVWPPHFRKEMAMLWNDPTVESWWLPNNEGKTRILGEIRGVVEERIVLAAQGPDDGRTDLREIKGLFEKMEIHGSRRASSASFDPAYMGTSAGMAHAASMVSTPEDGSSAGSASGFSPRASVPEAANVGGKQKPRGRKDSHPESPLSQSRSAPGNRMSGIWEEQP